MLKTGDEAITHELHAALSPMWLFFLTGERDWLSLSGKRKGTDRITTIIVAPKVNSIIQKRPYLSQIQFKLFTTAIKKLHSAPYLGHEKGSTLSTIKPSF